MDDENILDDDLSKSSERRRKLLPLWIRVFLWIFLILGITAPIGMVVGIMGINFSISLYGLETIQPISVTGIILILLFGFKGVVSLSLWTEKDWAVNLAMVDAVVGILVCLAVMFVLPHLSETNGFTFNLRLELVALIPYFIKMRDIKEEWEGRS